MKHRPRSTFTQRSLRLLILLDSPQHEALGQDIMHKLKEQHAATVFFGVGGVMSYHAGTKKVAEHPPNLNTNGLADFSPAKFFRRYFYRKTLQKHCREKDIDAVLTIGEVSHFLHCVKHLHKGLDIPFFHCGTCELPQKNSAKETTIKGINAYREIFCFYPFQAENLKEKGIQASFLGHPSFSSLSHLSATETAKPLGPPFKIAVLPCKKGRYVQRFMLLVADAVVRLRKSGKQVEVFLLLPGGSNPRHFENFSGMQAQYIRDWEDEALGSCDVAIDMRGENALRLAILGVPAISLQVFGQGLNWLFINWNAQQKNRVLNPVNRILQSQIVPEVTVLDLKKEKTLLAEKVNILLESPAMRQQQLTGFAQLRQKLCPIEAAPLAQTVAESIIGKLSRSPD